MSKRSGAPVTLTHSVQLEFAVVQDWAETVAATRKSNERIGSKFTGTV